MTLAHRSAAAALAFAESLKGQKRTDPNCPWATNPSMDDCAEFQSFVVWGGRPGPISWVDSFKTAIDGQYHRGKAGLQPGDVVLFDWDGNGLGNHVEMCKVAPGTVGNFTTVGANGSDTIAVADRLRSGYVLGYFRPAYGTTTISTASATTTPAASAALTSEEDDEMSAQDISDIKAALGNLTNIVAQVANAITDPNNGVQKNASTAAGKATDNYNVLQNVQNLIVDTDNRVTAIQKKVGA